MKDDELSTSVNIRAVYLNRQLEIYRSIHVLKSTVKFYSRHSDIYIFEIFREKKRERDRHRGRDRAKGERRKKKRVGESCSVVPWRLINSLKKEGKSERMGERERGRKID